LVRTGSYGLNSWLEAPALFSPVSPPGTNQFADETQIVFPALTPIAGDSVGPEMWFLADSSAPRNLIYTLDPSTGGESFSWIGPATPPDSCEIPRHGERPRQIPAFWPANQRLPGGINMAFVDGHAQLVPLENLWQLYWHKGYVPPAKRPGLP